MKYGPSRGKPQEPGIFVEEDKMAPKSCKLQLGGIENVCIRVRSDMPSIISWYETRSCANHVGLVHVKSPVLQVNLSRLGMFSVEQCRRRYKRHSS